MKRCTDKKRANLEFVISFWGQKNLWIRGRFRKILNLFLHWKGKKETCPQPFRGESCRQRGQKYRKVGRSLSVVFGNTEEWGFRLRLYPHLLGDYSNHPCQWQSIMICNHWSHIDNHHCTHPIPLCDQGRVKLKLSKSKIGIFRTRYDNTESKWRLWRQLSALGKDLLGEVVSAAGSIGRVVHRLWMSMLFNLFISLTEASPLQNWKRGSGWGGSISTLNFPSYWGPDHEKMTQKIPNKMQKSGSPNRYWKTRGMTVSV